MSKSSWVAVMGVATALVALPAAAQMSMSGFYVGAGVGQKSDVDVLGISALWRF